MVNSSEFSIVCTVSPDLCRLLFDLGLRVKILRCDLVTVLSVAGDLQELMLCLKIFCVAVGDGTAVLSSGALSLDAGTFPPP